MKPGLQIAGETRVNPGGGGGGGGGAISLHSTLFAWIPQRPAASPPPTLTPTTPHPRKRVSRLHCTLPTPLTPKACFSCRSCSVPLSGPGSRHMEEGGVVYCFTCWEQNFAHRCAKCGSAEGMGEASIKALDMHYHRQCFTCVECRSPLAGTQFVEKGGLRCCVGCAEVQRHYVGVGVDGYSDFKADGYRHPPPAAAGYRGMDEVIAASRPPTRAAPAAPPPPPSGGGYGDYGYEEGAPPPPPSSRTHVPFHSFQRSTCPNTPP